MVTKVNLLVLLIFSIFTLAYFALSNVFAQVPPPNITSMYNQGSDLVIECYNCLGPSKASKSGTVNKKDGGSQNVTIAPKNPSDSGDEGGKTTVPASLGTYNSYLQLCTDTGCSNFIRVTAGATKAGDIVVGSDGKASYKDPQNVPVAEIQASTFACELNLYIDGQNVTSGGKTVYLEPNKNVQARLSVLKVAATGELGGNPKIDWGNGANTVDPNTKQLLPNAPETMTPNKSLATRTNEEVFISQKSPFTATGYTLVTVDYPFCQNKPQVYVIPVAASIQTGTPTIVADEYTIKVQVTDMYDGYQAARSAADSSVWNDEQCGANLPNFHRHCKVFEAKRGEKNKLTLKAWGTNDTPNQLGDWSFDETSKNWLCVRYLSNKPGRWDLKCTELYGGGSSGGQPAAGGQPTGGGNTGGNTGQPGGTIPGGSGGGTTFTPGQGSGTTASQCPSQFQVCGGCFDISQCANGYLCNSSNQAQCRSASGGVGSTAPAAGGGSGTGAGAGAGAGASGSTGEGAGRGTAPNSGGNGGVGDSTGEGAGRGSAPGSGGSGVSPSGYGQACTEAGCERPYVCGANYTCGCPLGTELDVDGNCTSNTTRINRTICTPEEIQSCNERRELCEVVNGSGRCVPNRTSGQQGPTSPATGAPPSGNCTPGSCGSGYYCQPVGPTVSSCQSGCESNADCSTGRCSVHSCVASSPPAPPSNVPLGGGCQNSNQCAGAFTVCSSSGICINPPGSPNQAGSIPVGGNCTSSIQCQGATTVCRSGRCFETTTEGEP